VKMVEEERHRGDSQDQERPQISLVEKQRRLRASPGYQAYALMALIKRYSYILLANINQYNRLVNAMQDPSYGLSILDTRTPEKHDDLLSESERLLHNVLMAIKTRIDLLRVFMEKFFAEDSDLQDAFAVKAEEIFDADSAKFLERLRNHVTHHLLPVQRSVQTYSTGPMTFTLVLDAQRLLDWEWSARVRNWIEQQSPNLMIIDVINDYGGRANRFDTWLSQEISRKYQEELSEFWAATEILNREIARVFDS
jgi:hypothetical protein